MTSVFSASLESPSKPGRGVGRGRWKLLVLIALALGVAMAGAIRASAQARLHAAPQFDQLSAASASGAGEGVFGAAQRAGRTAAPLSPRFDEFTVRAVISRVPAPPETDLPVIESVVIDPESILPLAVNLRVPGVENEAWNQLTVDEQREYADEILRALVATYPEVETHLRRTVVYYSVNIWERFLVPASLEPANPEAPFICTPAPSDHLYRECDGAGIGAIVAVPAMQREQESQPLE